MHCNGPFNIKELEFDDAERNWNDGYINKERHGHLHNALHIISHRKLHRQKKLMNGLNGKHQQRIEQWA